MGTNEMNLTKYLNLWKIFEEKLEEGGLNLSSFAKKWEKFSDTGEENDYKKFYERIKSQKKRKDKLKSVQPNTISQIEDYIRFLDDSFVPFEALPDEKFGNLFN